LTAGNEGDTQLPDLLGQGQARGLGGGNRQRQGVIARFDSRSALLPGIGGQGVILMPGRQDAHPMQQRQFLGPARPVAEEHDVDAVARDQESGDAVGAPGGDGDRPFSRVQAGRKALRSRRCEIRGEHGLALVDPMGQGPPGVGSPVIGRHRGGINHGLRHEALRHVAGVGRCAGLQVAGRNDDFHLARMLSGQQGFRDGGLAGAQGVQDQEGGADAEHQGDPDEQHIGWYLDVRAAHGSSG